MDTQSKYFYQHFQWKAKELQNSDLGLSTDSPFHSGQVIKCKFPLEHVETIFAFWLPKGLIWSPANHF